MTLEELQRKIREHPGAEAATRLIEQDYRDAWDALAKSVDPTGRAQP